MSDKNRTKPLATTAGIALASTLAMAHANADQNPFEMSALSEGYMVAGMEGTCGGMKKEGEGKCGGMKKEGEGKCGGMKSDAKGAKKGGEGKCGEGKCGGMKK